MADAQAKERHPSVVWVISFIDLLTLMLTFFVMLFAMSHVKVDKWQHLIDTLSTTLNPGREKPTTVPTAEYNISTIFRKRAINLDYLIAVLQQKVDKSDVLKDSLLVPLEDRIIMSLAGQRLFRPGTAALTDAARVELFELGGVLRTIQNQIGVAGYSEEESFEGNSYTSDWELSLARAITVANALRSAGYRDEIVSYGYGRSRNVELAGTSAERRQILSRRIDIAIMATGGAL
jgi:chemotaxis protein MotB